MIYFIGGGAMWFMQAFLPSTGLLLAGLLVVAVLARFVRLPKRPGIIVVAVVAGTLFAYQTWNVWEAMSRPERAMFRRHIANPIPKSVHNLAPASAAPIVFHEGALVAFEAPDSVVQALLTHSLPGSRARAWLSEFKARNGRDTATLAHISSAGGAYLAVDTVSFPAELADVFRAAFNRVREGNRAGRDTFVHAETGEWGRMESVVSYDRSRAQVHVQQYVVRAPRQ